MAGYSIVLNLGGNAVTRTARLAANLELANANATKLVASLTAVAGAARGIPAGPMAVSAAGARSYAQQRLNSPDTMLMRAASTMNVAATKMSAAATKMGAASARQSVAAEGQNRAAVRQYTRHASNAGYGQTRIASFGTGFNLGPFGGRLSTVLQPDENGQLFGMDAGRLMQGTNAAGMAAGLLKSMLSTMLKSTIYPMLLNGGALAGLTGMLSSEFIGRGVALNSRRLMARNVLGADFEMANTQADFLASTYGIDRGISLGNIASLTGLRVNGATLDSTQAAEITRIGGLIAMQSGAPVERIMINLQQLFSQINPNLRDIRELINQAPILGKYALREMERAGIGGSDYRTFLKDRGALTSTLASFALDNPLTATMVSRGNISTAWANAGATIAGNDSAWRRVGSQAVNMINTLAIAGNNLITSLTSNTNFQNAINNLAIGLESIGRNSDAFVNIIWSVSDFISRYLGIDLGNKNDAADRTARAATVEAALGNSAVRSYAISAWMERNGGLYADQSQRQRAAEQWYEGTFMARALGNNDLIQGVRPLGDRRFGVEYQTSSYIPGLRTYNYVTPTEKSLAASTEAMLAQRGLSALGVYAPRGKNLSQGMYGAYEQPIAAARALADSILSEGTQGSLGGLGLGGGTSGIAGSGTDLSGMNRDRKALEIHFHAPIVEWNSTIEAASPQEVVEEVAQNIEELASAAMQKVLLGATNKMASSWY